MQQNHPSSDTRPWNELYDGSAEPPAPPVPLKAGPLTALFEPATGVLRYVRIGDHEVLRGIYGAVRDRNWDTISPRLSDLAVDAGPDSFRITFTADCVRDDINFRWQGTVVGESSGRIVYEFDGEARSEFLRNRIGLCVLHPIAECSGKACTVETVDGRTESGTFPTSISPHQPFKNIRAITHEPAPGVRTEVRFVGETFEMEDQRNWTDASFKTYGTPLELPFPVAVRPGDRIRQSVFLGFPTPPRKILPIQLGRGAQFSIATTPVLPMPAVGLCLAGPKLTLSDREAARLKQLRLSHLRADVRFTEGGWRETLNRAIHEAERLEIGLQLALHLTDDAESELKTLLSSLTNQPARVSLWQIFHVNESATSETWIQKARQTLSGYGHNILLAAGANEHFVEWNRHRPPPDSPALPCYSITPQVHAFDNATMVETLAAQSMTVATARQHSPRAVVISPITLRPRLHPIAASSMTETRPGDVPADADPRQGTLFGAGWTLGSIARLATAGGVHSLTYYETTGWRGLMASESDNPPWGPLRIPAGSVYPVYHVFADLAGFQKVFPTLSSHPLQTEALTLHDAQNRRRILVANLLGESQEIKIKTGTCQARVRYLDETNAELAMQEPEAFQALTGDPLAAVAGKLTLELKPFALARVDIVN